MAQRRRSGLGILPRRTLAGWAVVLENHHPAVLALADPARGRAIHKHRRALHVDLVPGHLEPVPVVVVLGQGILAGQFIFSIIGTIVPVGVTVAGVGGPYGRRVNQAREWGKILIGPF